MKRVFCMILALALLLGVVSAQAEWKVGDKFELGKWSMEGDPKPISWTIISVNSVFLLALADEPVAYYPWNSAEGNQSWDNSSLREWLGSSFKTSAFSKAENKILQRQLVENTPYNDDPDSGLDTWDYIYILSAGEVETYLVDDLADLVNIGTDWWLRNHGDDGATAAYIDTEGSLQPAGAALTEYKAVRPVILVLSTSLK